jgi:hypothetical protein
MDDLDDITRKLADDADELDLDSEADLGAEDDVINLLEDEASFSTPSLPRGGGLDYEQPDLRAASFAETLQQQQAGRQQTSKPAAADEPDSGPDSLLDDDDPMLLIDEELLMDKDANDGGILTLAALVLALLGLGVAGFATFQNLGLGEQIGALASQLETPPPDPKLPELEAMIGQNDKKLAQLQAQQTTDSGAIKDLSNRFDLLLEETRKEDTNAKLETISQEIKGLGGKLSAMEQRLNTSQGQLEQQQEALRSEFSDRLSKLSTNPPPSQVSASTRPEAVKGGLILQPQTGQAPSSPPPSPPPPSVTGFDPLAQQGPADAGNAPDNGPQNGSADGAGEEPAGGLWVANLASFNQERDASRTLKQLQGHGIFPKKRKVEVKGQIWYRLYVDGFANATAARRYVDKVKGKPGLSRAWVGKAP